MSQEMSFLTEERNDNSVRGSEEFGG